jgi:AcrR family transcriptional regulator
VKVRRLEPRRTPSSSRKLPFKARLSRADRQAVIKEEAERLFADRGYDGTTLEGIAEASGVSRAVVYEHFASKAELHAKLLKSETDRLLGYVGQSVAEAPPAAEARLRAGVSAFFVFVEEHPFARRMIFRDPPADALIAATHAEIQAQATRAIAAMLAEGARAEGVPVAGQEGCINAFAEMLKVAQNCLAARGGTIALYAVSNSSTRFSSSRGTVWPRL